MAGIAGIIVKKGKIEQPKLNNIIKTMLNQLTVTVSQNSWHYEGCFFACGNVSPINAKENNRYFYNANINCICIFEGLIFIDDFEKVSIRKHYKIDRCLSDLEYLTYLFDYYRNNIGHHLTGWYNLFAADLKKNEALLINDRLGYLPLYYYESDTVFMFSSKIEGLLKLIPQIEFDLTTVAEHLFFNYSLSDHTFIKGIKTFENASIVQFDGKKIFTQTYWYIDQLFYFQPQNEQESICLIKEGLKKSLNKLFVNNNENLYVSLTGGWDSRVVLSCLLPEYKERLLLFSFGAADSADIIVPQKIANDEKIKYLPYILDEQYLKQDFLNFAYKTIELSNGTRNYKRSHYLYSIKKLENCAETIVTGIFGDEIFKTAHVVGGIVLSNPIIELIENKFNYDHTLDSFRESPIYYIIRTEKNRIIDNMEERLHYLKKKMSRFESAVQCYYAFRFELNLRKYFGSEVNSYSDYVNNFSPFIDYDFLKHFAKTKFFGIHYKFNSNSFKLKRQSTYLYYQIIKDNYLPLLFYNTSRGYSIAEVKTFKGNLKILKNILRKQKKDSFNTQQTDFIFYDSLKNQSNLNTDIQLINNFMSGTQLTANVNSMVYWLDLITARYL